MTRSRLVQLVHSVQKMGVGRAGETGGGKGHVAASSEGCMVRAKEAEPGLGDISGVPEVWSPAGCNLAGGENNRSESQKDCG